MTGDREQLHRVLRMKAQRLAAIIQQTEVMTPGCFGEAGSVIRQLAAGDDVAPDDLAAALASLKMILEDAAALLEEILPPKPRQP